MLRGLYHASSALQSASLNQDIFAENLANATTPGFRRLGMSFEALLAGTSPPGQAGRGPGTTTSTYTSFTPGPLERTGNTYDLAISGDAFFVLDGPSGAVYTRNGGFEVNSQGELQTPSGLRVRGEGGRITIPQTAGRVTIAADGSVMADGAQVGRLQLAKFDNPQALRRVGPTLFEGPAPRVPEPGSVRLEQGFREGSNVQMVQEMISMMIGLRQYEAAERTLKAIGDATGLNTRPQG